MVVLGETLFKQKVVAGEYGDFCQLGTSIHCPLPSNDMFLILKNLVFSAYFNDVSVGGLIAKRESPLLIQIEFLGVLPHYRKQGLGAKLLRFLETISRKSLSNTNTIVELQCKISLSDSASRAFFVDKNGFVVKETLSSSESNSNNNNNSQSLILSKFISKD